MRFSLFYKIIIFISIFVFVLIGSIVTYSFVEFNEIFKNQIFHDLRGVAEYGKGQIFLLFEKFGTRTADWSFDNHIRTEFEEIIKSNDSQRTERLAEYIRTKKQSMDNGVIITDIFNLNGIVKVSTFKERVGHSEPLEELDEEYNFDRAKSASYGKFFISVLIYEDEPGHSEPLWHVSVPIVSPKTDKVIGVMVNHISGKEYYEVLSGKFQVKFGSKTDQIFLSERKTAEIYLVNDKKLMMTPSKFVGEATLKQTVDTVPVKKCLEENEEFAGSYKNYLGQNVVGASACFGDSLFGRNMILLIEIGEDEIFTEFNKEIIHIFLIGILIWLAGISGIYLIVRFFLSEIFVISKAASEVADGNLNAKVEIKSNDEIGDLAETFNKMVDKIKNSQNIIKEKRDLFNAVISSMGEGLIVVDKNYKIILINETAKNKLEVSEEAVGKDIKEVAPVVKGNQKIADEEMPVFKTFKTGKPVTVWLDDNFYYQLPSGKKFPITLIDAPLIKDGDIAAAVIIFRDVTDEKKLDEAKNNFISIASHQLRTPLTTIRWYSELLEAGDAGKLNKGQKDFLKEIYGGALKLTETLNMLLALARVEGGRMKFTPEKVDLIKFTEEILKDLEPFSKPKKIKISLKSEKSTPIVQLDKLILTQVISNLLTNAFRYIKENGEIEIDIVDKQREIVYSVKDNGIGIPENQKNRIFERFFRAENAILKASDGNGLGLYLVKNLVELWKGKIWFESPAVWGKEKKGTAFYFTIPIN